jgi:hypothetical protein
MAVRRGGSGYPMGRGIVLDEQNRARIVAIIGVRRGGGQPQDGRENMAAVAIRDARARNHRINDPQ